MGGGNENTIALSQLAWVSLATVLALQRPLAALPPGHSFPSICHPLRDLTQSLGPWLTSPMSTVTAQVSLAHCKSCLVAGPLALLTPGRVVLEA